MTFAEWLILVERSGVPVSGVDTNWLQHQFQMQQQPALVAHMIRAGQAPRMMTQPIGFGGSGRSRRSSTGSSIFVGIVGTVALVGGLLYGLKYIGEHGIGGIKPAVSSGVVVDAPQVSEEKLKSKGLDPAINYPYWPLVYDLTGMKADKDTITGKVTNYGDKPVNTVLIQFGLFTKNHDKVGIAQDQIGSLGPGETWSYQASVKGLNYEDCRLDSITFK